MVIVNSYSGYKYNIFRKIGTNQQVSMGTINLRDNGLFSVDLYDQKNVFQFSNLSKCLQFFEEVSSLYSLRGTVIEKINVDRYANTIVLEAAPPTFLGTITATEYNHCFNIFNFNFYLFNQDEINEFIGLFERYLKELGEKIFVHS